mgnify:CR=1 FL=1
MSKNSLGRELPEQVGSYCVRPYEGAYQPLPEVKPVVTRRTAGHRVPGGNKLVPTAGSRSFKRIWFPPSVPRGSGTA